jgi:hypothetical protein
MNRETFQKSLAAEAPPPGLSLALQALWYAAKGDWNTAHERAQEQDDRDGAWVHAHLHRQEGDLGNAGYWYHRAGQPVATQSIPEEWEVIVGALLTESPV